MVRNAFARSFSPERNWRSSNSSSLMNETRLFGRDFLFRLRALRRVGFFRGELPQRFEIFHRALELAQRIQERAHARNFLDIALGALAIRPKIRRRSCALRARSAGFLASGRQRNLRNSRTRDWRASASITGTSVAMDESSAVSGAWRNVDLCSADRSQALRSERLYLNSASAEATARGERSFRLPSSDRADRAPSFPDRSDRS